MPKFVVFKERPDIPGDKSLERLLETDDEHEAMTCMMAASRPDAMAMVFPAECLLPNCRLDTRYHVEVARREPEPC